MKLLCKLIRKGGTTVSMGDTIYHFKPDAEGLHVCDVDNLDHAKRLLAIPEAYASLVDAANLPDEQKQLVTDAGDGEEDTLPPPADDDPVNDGEFDMMMIPSEMSNEDLNRYARSRGFNHKSKKDIADYALDNFEEALETAGSGIKPAQLIRQVYVLEQAEILEEEEYDADSDDGNAPE